MARDGSDHARAEAEEAMSKGKRRGTEKPISGKGTGRKAEGPELPEYARDAMRDFLQKIYKRRERREGR